jgi:hypothetical protein
MTRTDPNYGKLTATLIGAWFILFSCRLGPASLQQ